MNSQCYSNKQQKEKLIYSERHLLTDCGCVTVEGPVSRENIISLNICAGLHQFRQPKDQQRALAQIAALPEGLVYLAHINQTIVGYITFHYPEFERWAHAGIANLLELGAIEVSRAWRGKGIATALVEIPFTNSLLEDKIIISLECYWFWDIRGMKLNTWHYRQLMQDLLAKGGFETKLTDDPDICSHPANLLSVRVGSLVDAETRAKFDSICYLDRKGHSLIFSS
ncbi:MAG: GNAT family N-acetyltransferase [Firmicutes bacterium]|nr:GNAT family N-acetyltransferase [Bacillota bacterium]